jgi:hypothetical protein
MGCLRVVARAGDGILQAVNPPPRQRPRPTRDGCYGAPPRAPAHGLAGLAHEELAPLDLITGR